MEPAKWWRGSERVPEGGGEGWSRVKWEREGVPVNGRRQDRKRNQIRQKRTDTNKLTVKTKGIT